LLLSDLSSLRYPDDLLVILLNNAADPKGLGDLDLTSLAGPKLSDRHPSSGHISTHLPQRVQSSPDTSM
jgi:hypothetical protein